MNNRYERDSDLQHNDYDYGMRQPQQFDTSYSGQQGEMVIDRNTARDRTQLRDRGLSDDYDRQSFDRQPMGRQRSYDRIDEDREVLASRATGRRNSNYGRFTTESYGGRDYAAPVHSSHSGASYAGGYGHRYGERSFLDRAGDEIASWFGDDEAARRREIDHRGAGPQGYTRSDERILDDVCDRLTEDRYVDASDIAVKVQDREVTLDGTVDSKGAKRRAEDCADYVTGVTHVQNNLRVSEKKTLDTENMQRTAS